MQVTYVNLRLSLNNQDSDHLVLPPHIYLNYLFIYYPRAQVLEGAPAQLVVANFKTEISPRQISKVTSLQCRINLAAKVVYAMGYAFPRGRCRIY